MPCVGSPSGAEVEAKLWKYTSDFNICNQQFFVFFWAVCYSRFKNKGRLCLDGRFSAFMFVSVMVVYFERLRRLKLHTKKR